MHIMESLKAELHCHNIFSNGHVGYLEPIHDCNVTIPQQLEQAYLTGLDVLFVTNHNTIDGYKQMLEYKKKYRKFDTLSVYPAEEVTTDNESHVLVYGVDHAIKSGLSLHELCHLICFQSKLNWYTDQWWILHENRCQQLHANFSLLKIFLP